MPRTPQTGTAVRIDEKHHEILRKLVKSSGKTQIYIFEFLLELADVNDLLNKGWQDRLLASLERGRREIEFRQFSNDPDRCVALATGVEKFKCVWGREGKPPQIRVLESEYEASLDLCLRCKKTKRMLAENQGLINKNIALENKLKNRVDIKYKIPICHKGATLNEDGTAFTNCQKRRGVPVSVSEFCKKISNGLPCALFAERLIGVAEKID